MADVSCHVEPQNAGSRLLSWPDPIVDKLPENYAMQEEIQGVVRKWDERWNFASSIMRHSVLYSKFMKIVEINGKRFKKKKLAAIIKIYILIESSSLFLYSKKI